MKKRYRLLTLVALLASGCAPGAPAGPSTLTIMPHDALDGVDNNASLARGDTWVSR